jgi:hypothetical protein
MSTGPSRDAAEFATDTHVWRLQAVMEQLDLNIARLALALGVSLGTKEDLSQALRDSRPGPPAPLNAAHRVDHMHAQLRGLLVLRYNLIQKCAAEIGPDATWQIMVEVETHMEAHGFVPGADGISRDLLHRPA